MKDFKIGDWVKFDVEKAEELDLYTGCWNYPYILQISGIVNYHIDNRLCFDIEHRLANNYNTSGSMSNGYECFVKATQEEVSAELFRRGSEKLKQIREELNMGEAMIVPEKKNKEVPSEFSINGKPHHLKAMWEDLMEMGYVLTLDKYTPHIQKRSLCIAINHQKCNFKTNNVNDIISIEHEVRSSDVQFNLPEQYSEALKHCKERFKIVEEYFKKDMKIAGANVEFLEKGIQIEDFKISKQEIKELYNHFYSK